MNKDKNKDKEKRAKAYRGVTVIRNLKAVRKRPGMYIGSTRSLDGKSPQGLIHVAQEILSNAIDEAYAGFGHDIQMIVHKDNSLTVVDHGRGLPTGGKDFKSAIATFTELHSSAKFDDSSYANSLGTNGVGATSTNAVSQFLDVEAVTELHEHYHLRFKQDQLVIKEWLPYKKSMSTGTKVTFLPDDQIFDVIQWDDEPLINMMEQSAFLTPQVKFEFFDERQSALADDQDHDCFYQSWYSTKGMADYVTYLSQSEDLLRGLKEPIAFNDNYHFERTIAHGQGAKVPVNEEIRVQGALIYTNENSNSTFSFVNGGATSDNGTHVDGAYAAISRAFRDYLEDHRSELKVKRGRTIDAQDTREGLILALLVKLPESLMMFDSQEKTHLVTPEAKKAVQEIVYNHLMAWLADHPQTAKSIIDNMVDAKRIRDEALKNRKAARKARKTKSMAAVSPKLKPASSKEPKKKSLFIGEGDSACALLNMVRDKKYQAVFPIRGKILNTQKAKLSAAMSNEEISTIASVIGAGIGPSFDEKQMQYDKIIIASDADIDGSHIASLLMTLFYRFFPGLIEHGHLYRVISPLYMVKLKNKSGKEKYELAYDEGEHDDYLQRIQQDQAAGWQQVGAEERFKGLGSLTPALTKRFLADPRYRKLVQIKISADQEQMVKKMLNIWMGKSADLRKEQIHQVVDFDDVQID